MGATVWFSALTNFGSLRYTPFLLLFLLIIIIIIISTSFLSRDANGPIVHVTIFDQNEQHKLLAVAYGYAVYR